MAEVSYARGLAGVIADESKICVIDGVKGELYYMGYPIQELAEKSNFTEASYLLIYGKLPSKTQLENFRAELTKNREIPKFIEETIKKFPKKTHPMTALQTCVAMLGMEDIPSEKDSRETNQKRSVKLIAQFPTLVAYFARHREGKDIVKPNSDLCHAANFLYMLNGEAPTDEIAKMFDTCLLLHAEHTFNASTFTGRVVAATLADLYTSVSAATGALFGPLHGGANEKALEMAKSIGSVDNVDKWFDEAMASKTKIMGMGHRVYKTIDPRAKILKGLLLDLSKKAGNTNQLEVLDKLAEKMAEKVKAEGKEIWPNVDYFSGTLYELMGIDSIYFTPIFAVARVAGWSAHILELWTDNKLYRPKCLYTGDIDLKYVDIADRA
ncbi:MAG: citrate synthase [Candidatus Cloacimonadota bacterium]|nr:MAG: citrate synthase [Candidatus Cloacimonadota bacterium]